MNTRTMIPAKTQSVRFAVTTEEYERLFGLDEETLLAAERMLGLAEPLPTAGPIVGAVEVDGQLKPVRKILTEEDRCDHGYSLNAILEKLQPCLDCTYVYDKFEMGL